MNMVKINFDGVVFTKEKKSGVGMVVRDAKGLVLASCAKEMHQPFKAMVIESLVAATPLSFATNLGFRRVVLEGDSMDVIQALRENAESLTPRGLLLEDVRMLSQNFEQLLYSHTKREGNSVAHNLAKYALCFPDFLALTEDVLPQIQSILQANLACFH